MIQVLMIIIACGSYPGGGCNVHSAWVVPQTCLNAQAQIKRFPNTEIGVWCIDSKKPEQ